MSQTIFLDTHISFVRPCISLWCGSLTSPKALYRQGVLLARLPIRGCQFNGDRHHRFRLHLLCRRSFVHRESRSASNRLTAVAAAV